MLIGSFTEKSSNHFRPEVSGQGRANGSFQISRDRLLYLSGRKYLEESWLKELWEACLNEDVALTDLGEVYAVMEAGVLLLYRAVPYKMCK
jgi:hypothetical protein